MSQQAKAFLNSFVVYPPPNMNTNGPEFEAYRTRISQQMASQIAGQDSAAQRLTHYVKQTQQLEQAGQEVPADLLEKKQHTETLMQQAKARVHEIRSMNERNRAAVAARERENAARQQNNAANAGSPPNAGVAQGQIPNQAQAQQMRQPPQNAAQAMFNANNNPMGGNQQGGGDVPGRTSMSPSTSQPFQNPNQAVNAMQQPQNQMQMPQQPQGPMQGRPLPNPQQQAAFAAQPHQSPSTQMPGAPGSQQGHPQPLSHQAAMSAAARTYSEQQQRNTPTGPGTPGQFPSIGTSVNANSKMPIPKQLNVSSPAPVAMGPARPTFGGGAAPGMMGQPAITKNPGFILEGEGDRVLSKKKLDELVRQVTGGGEGDGLTPEVEEVCILSTSVLTISLSRWDMTNLFSQGILAMADDFVDNVITAACRLAKIRPNSTLDIRDIQIILERNYNIRVPGYSLDEIRTVRKFQPAPGWTQKMNAVQAAKVMGKNDS